MTVTATAAPRRDDETRPRALVQSAPLTERQVDARLTVPDIVDVWGCDSFPASDAPANW